MKQQTLKQLQDKIWGECRRIVRARYEHSCYSCGATDLYGANLHTGHMVAKKYLHYTMKYDLRLLRPQCYNCNMNLGGMGALFLDRMRNEEGEGYVQDLLADVRFSDTLKLKEKAQKVPDKIKREFFAKLLEEYKEIKY